MSEERQETRQAGNSAAARRALRTALALNAAMFVINLVAGLVARSSGLLADGIDMLSDATIYGLSLMAMSRSGKFKNRTAFASGLLLAVSGAAVIADAIHRFIVGAQCEQQQDHPSVETLFKCCADSFC